MNEERIKERLSEAAPVVVENMLSMLNSPDTPAAVKVHIYEIIFDRVLGKPEETIHLDETVNNTEEAERMIAAFAERIRKKGEASDAGEINLQ